MQFTDRIDAGRRLAESLRDLHGSDAVVLGLPRGGVVVAREVARALDAPLDVIVVRKLGVPSRPELGMGAIGEGGVRIINEQVMRFEGITEADLMAVEERERDELERRADRFRSGRERIPVAGRTVIVVDDGIATGSTARAACQVARAQGAARVVLAVPVAPPDTVAHLREDVDELVCLDTPDDFFAVGQWYRDFRQTTDDEVVACLDDAAAAHARDQAASAPGHHGLAGCDDEVLVECAGVRLPGHLTVARGAIGVVVFAHGSDSSRHSPRNQLVARVLNEAGLGTLLFDLLTTEEGGHRENVFDIELLAGRLTGATAWLREQPEAFGARIGYFGASTGAAAALCAAADPDAGVTAIVSRGGRPDLAGPRLSAVTAPTLMIVGSDDHYVLDLNRAAQAQLQCANSLAIVQGATHLFEEPGTLHQAAELACEWFVDHLTRGATPEPYPFTDPDLNPPMK